jgi:alpha-galactosidase
MVRMKIQYGTSLAYPTRCIGAHVSSVPNHITGNYTRIRTRTFVAMCGTFGYELDVSTASNTELLQIKEHISLFRTVCPIIWEGDMYRIWNPFKVEHVNQIYYQYTHNIRKIRRILHLGCMFQEIKNTLLFSRFHKIVIIGAVLFPG